MIKPTYHRLSRTSSSEQYQLMEGDQRLGHLDLHYATSDVFGTLVLERELSEEETIQLIEQIDEDLVQSAEVPREDLYVRVYLGRETFWYTEDFRDEYAVDGHEEFDDE